MEKTPFVWLAEMYKLDVMREMEFCLAMTLALCLTLWVSGILQKRWSDPLAQAFDDVFCNGSNALE